MIKYEKILSVTIFCSVLQTNFLYGSASSSHEDYSEKVKPQLSIKTTIRTTANQAENVAADQKLSSSSRNASAAAVSSENKGDPSENTTPQNVRLFELCKYIAALERTEILNEDRLRSQLTLLEEHGIRDLTNRSDEERDLANILYLTNDLDNNAFNDLIKLVTDDELFSLYETVFDAYWAFKTFKDYDLITACDLIDLTKELDIIKLMKKKRRDVSMHFFNLLEHLKQQSHGDARQRIMLLKETDILDNVIWSDDLYYVDKVILYLNGLSVFNARARLLLLKETGVWDACESLLQFVIALSSLDDLPPHSDERAYCEELSSRWSARLKEKA